MGVRALVWRLLSSGSAPVLDPDEPVEVAIVPLSEGPMLVSALQAAGIEAVGYEAASGARTSVIMSLNHMRILVRRADLAAATALLDELQST